MRVRCDDSRQGRKVLSKQARQLSLQLCVLHAIPILPGHLSRHYRRAYFGCCS